MDGEGLSRRRRGRGFSYHWPDGSQVGEAETLARISALAIPPAWEEVWICPWPNGHIQAVGTDARGRRQYRYHDEWRRQRDRQKFERVVDFARALPGLRAAVAEDLTRSDMGRDRVLAAAVRLLDLGFFRIGGEDYAEENHSFGLATLLKSHVRVQGETLVFDYTAKSGRRRVQAVADPEVLAVVGTLRRRRGGGPELLAWQDGRRWVDVRSEDINAYIKDRSGGDFTAKDFRTWSATVLAAVALAVSWPVSGSPSARKRAEARAMKEVAGYLGNTPAVCRRAYIDPRVVDRFRGGEGIRGALDTMGAGAEEGQPATRGAVEAAVVDLLEG